MIRQAVLLLACAAAALSACNLFSPVPDPQGGSPAIATQATDAFLRALVQRDTAEAWSHLSPATQEVVYDNDHAAFAMDVDAADWSRMTWQFGTVTDLDVSWGVHVLVDDATLPAFLVEREIAAGWSGFGIVLHVQTPEGRPYLIAVQGLDYRLKTYQNVAGTSLVRPCSAPKSQRSMPGGSTPSVVRPVHT